MAKYENRTKISKCRLFIHEVTLKEKAEEVLKIAKSQEENDTFVKVPIEKGFKLVSVAKWRKRCGFDF